MSTRGFEECVAGGGVVLFGADTLYGLGCDPANAAAIARIHEIKGRPEAKPSAVMFFDPLTMREVLSGAGPRTLNAIGALLPGALTLVIDNPNRLYPGACGDDPTRLGIRLIDGPLAGARVPLFQTSANRSGEPPPASLAEVSPEIADAVDLAIDCGPASGAPSTVVDVTGIDDDPASWRVLRAGAVPESRVAALLASF